MGKALADWDPIVRDLFAAADRVLGFSLSRLCFEGPESDLTLTANAQPAILTASVAVATVLQAKGVKPAAVAGHSLGEYSALVAASSLSFEDAVLAVHKRGRYMQEAVPVGVGAMAAVLGLDLESVARLCEEASAEGSGLAAVANDNAPGQVVVAGHVAAVDRTVALAKAKGARRAMRLTVSAPFHCDLMLPARESLAKDLKAVTFRDLDVPLVTNVDAHQIHAGEEARESLIRQVTSRVRWTDSVHRLAAMGIRRAVEAGPGQVLSGLVKRIEAGISCVSAGDPASIEAVAASGSGG
jgi:[acyl-carrier-protein] S-malonyltransferase